MASAGGKGIQGHLHRLVSDGVESHLKSRVHALFGHLGQLGMFILRQARIAGIVGVRIDQRCGARAERAIHEPFQHAGV
jgi:hypothetical protein